MKVQFLWKSICEVSAWSRVTLFWLTIALSCILSGEDLIDQKYFLVNWCFMSKEDGKVVADFMFVFWLVEEVWPLVFTLIQDVFIYI